MATSKGTVVLATDNSERALTVVDYALKHYSDGYDLHVIHVQPVHPNMMRHADETYQLVGLDLYSRRSIDQRGNAEGQSSAEGRSSNEGKATSKEVEHQKFLVDKILPKFDGLSTTSGKKQPVKATVIYVPDNTAHAIGKAICKYAKEHIAEALVLERSSKSFLSDFFLGSVASYCASHAKVPLVILKN